MLLAGLYADGKTSVTEPALSRNHTELMLRSFGVKVESHDTTATITPPEEMIATDIVVPGDISSATFFIVAGLITKFMYPFKKCWNQSNKRWNPACM